MPGFVDRNGSCAGVHGSGLAFVDYELLRELSARHFSFSILRLAAFNLRFRLSEGFSKWSCALISASIPSRLQ